MNFKKGDSIFKGGEAKMKRAMQDIFWAVIVLYFVQAESPSAVSWSQPLKPEYQKKIESLLKLPVAVTKTRANTEIIGSALLSFTLGTGRLPDSPQELFQSVYFPIAVDDFINPYTGKPVAIVEKPSLGDYIWIKRVVNGRKEVAFEGFIDPTGDGKKILPGPSIGLAESDMLPRKSVTELYQRETALYNEQERKVFWMCHNLTQLIGTAKNYLGYIPASYKEFMQLDWLYNPAMWKNIYTGQPIQDVSYFNPQPGDFTYAGLLGEDGNITSPFPVCYNDKKEIVFPTSGDRYLLQQLLQAEKETGQSGILLH